MMRLTDTEKRMLEGEHGESPQTAMKMLIAVGEIYGAEKMIPVRSAHVAGLSLKTHGIAGMEWAEDIARKGGRIVVPTTMNVIGVDRSRDLKLPKEWVANQLRIERAYENMGCYGTSTCVPYYLGFVPRCGESVAWAESSAVAFVNSVLGARDNREGGPSAIASGLTGVTPCYGLHLDANRLGDVHFRIRAELEDISDYGALGAFVGRMIGTRIAVFSGIQHPTMEDLVSLGAALASSGSAAMYHIVGVTPEAPTLKAAFGNRRYDTVQVTGKELAAESRKTDHGHGQEGRLCRYWLPSLQHRPAERGRHSS